MNANELADKLEKCCLVSWGECNHEDYDTDIWTKMKSATMLRQQQAEIEALKKQVIGDEYVFICKRCGDELGIKLEEKEEPTVDEVMAEHCTCYKLGYSQLNNFTKVETK